MISLLCFLLPYSKLCIYTIHSFLHCLSPFFLPVFSSVWGRRKEGREGGHSLQRPDDVHTRPLRSDTKKLAFLSLSHCQSLSVRFEKTQEDKAFKGRPSLWLLTCSFHTALTLPPLGRPVFPRGDSASPGHIIKSVWATRSTSQSLHTRTRARTQFNLTSLIKPKDLPKLALVKQHRFKKTVPVSHTRGIKASLE